MADSTKPKIFIASPLFNGPQIETIIQIERLLSDYGYDFYSARLHSGSGKMTSEQRKDINAWDPVFDANEQGLNECRVMIAVLEYALPEGDKTELFQRGAHVGMDFDGEPEYASKRTRIELPDAGTVWEAGYFRAQGKLVLGFHTNQAKHLNLMLSHGCDGMIRGFGNLRTFLGGSDFPAGLPITQRLTSRAYRMLGYYADFNLPKSAQILLDATLFDWSAVEQWDAKTKEVE